MKKPWVASLPLVWPSDGRSICLPAAAAAALPPCPYCSTSCRCSGSLLSRGPTISSCLSWPGSFSTSYCFSGSLLSLGAASWFMTLVETLARTSPCLRRLCLLCSLPVRDFRFWFCLWLILFCLVLWFSVDSVSSPSCHLRSCSHVVFLVVLLFALCLLVVVSRHGFHSIYLGGSERCFGMDRPTGSLTSSDMLAPKLVYGSYRLGESSLIPWRLLLAVHGRVKLFSLFVLWQG